MAAAAAIAAAAVAATATVAGSVISSQGAKSAASAARPSSHKFPLPQYLQGLERYQTRLLAENLKAVPPSFAQYVQSGGQARFPLTDPGFSPQEARKLGIVGPRGQQIPFVQAGQSELTPEQQLYIGYVSALQGKSGPLAQAYRLNRDVGRLEVQKQTPFRVAKEQRLRTRRDYLLNPPPAAGGLK